MSECELEKLKINSVKSQCVSIMKIAKHEIEMADESPVTSGSNKKKRSLKAQTKQIIKIAKKARALASQSNSESTRQEAERPDETVSLTDSTQQDASERNMEDTIDLERLTNKKKEYL